MPVNSKRPATVDFGGVRSIRRDVLQGMPQNQNAESAADPIPEPNQISQVRPFQSECANELRNEPNVGANEYRDQDKEKPATAPCQPCYCVCEQGIAC